jgi:hypothetical protein
MSHSQSAEYLLLYAVSCGKEHQSCPHSKNTVLAMDQAGSFEGECDEEESQFESGGRL